MLAIMKGFSGFGAFMILLIGLAMIGITIFGYLNSEIFLNDTSYRDGIMGVMAGASSLIILGAILGICGIKKGNALMICVFQIFVIVFLIIFFSLGIAAQVMPSKFFDGNCTTSSNAAIIQTSKAFNISQNLCRGTCACAMSNASLSKYDAVDQAILRSPLYVLTGRALNIQNCSIANISKLDFALAGALGQVEKYLECSLWCQGSGVNLFYRFSNVNNGKPKYFCYSELKKQVEKYGGTVGIAAFVAAAFLLLVCACNMCICCHPKRRGLSMKDRFVYMNNGQYTNLS